MKDPLTKLFGSVGRVKIMRLFLANQEECMQSSDVIRQTKTLKDTVTKELRILEQAGFLNKTNCKIEQVKKLKKGDKIIKKTKPGYKLNTNFEYLQALRTILTQVSGDQSDDLSKRMRKTGRIKVLIVAGVFLQDTNNRVDILIVGDAIKHRLLETVIRATEAEMGQGLRYAVFSTNEFKYRLGMRDKLISDILDSPHKKLLDKLGL
jgi:DNA-binding MarR family transcriptional regulator